MIIIKELHTKSEIKEFVKFPFSLYKDNPYWVPPLIESEVASFDKTQNPVFENAQAYFYMAYKQRKPVGRVVAIINKYDLKNANTQKIRFGWLDMIDDIEVTKALLEKVAEKGREYKLNYMEGPMGFSNMDKVGVLTEGYDHISNMMTWYSYPYYKEHLKQLNLTKEKGYVEISFLVKDVHYDSFKQTAEIIRKRYKLKVLETNTIKEILPYIDEMFALYNQTYSVLSSFVPINQRQIDYFKKKYLPFVNPKYIRFIADSEGKIICFAIVLPSFSKALQKAKGKLFPFGFWHLLNARRKNDTVEFYLIGVSPEYQSKGVPSLLFDYFYPVFKRNGIKKCISTPELEDNIAIQQLWKNFNPTDFARRSTYRKDL